MMKYLKYAIAITVTITLSITVAYYHGIYTWESSPQTMWIAEGQLFDATNEKPVSNPGILIENGVISCIGNSCDRPSNVLVVKATGKSIVPGLIDLHGHFFSGTENKPNQNIPTMIWQQLKFLPEVRQNLIESGITSYRSVGDVMPAIMDLKKKVQAQELAGPRLFIAGPIFTISGGHPTNRPGIPQWVIENMTVQSDDADDVTKKVMTLAEQGIDGIKVVYQQGVDKNGNIVMPRMSQNTLMALGKAAKSQDLWLAVHSGPTEETITAINAGVTTIEHGIRHGTLINEQLLDLIKNNNIVYVPTLGREPQGHLNIAALNKHNIVLGVGTDSPVMLKGNSSFHAELSRMVNAGLPDVKALIAATRNGALGLKMADKLGTIETGKLADLLIVDGKPWQDIHTLKNIEKVVIGGRIAYNKDDID
jgi:enamidase